jgi:hypothetical protein
MHLARKLAAALVFVTCVPFAGLAQPAPETATPPAAAEASPVQTAQETGKRAEVLYDPGLLPEPVRQMRERIREAALSGDLEKLRVAIQSNEMPPVLSFVDEGQTDPIEAMKSASGDGSGLEILAILSEILDAGYVHLDQGTPQEMYVWPYFVQTSLDNLTPAQTVELYRLVTAFDLEQMKEFGAYNFYRVGIGPDGVWHFFVAGD